MHMGPHDTLGTCTLRTTADTFVDASVTLYVIALEYFLERKLRTRMDNEEEKKEARGEANTP